MAKNAYYTLDIPESKVQSIRYPDACCCCGVAVGPGDRKILKDGTYQYPLPVCPACQKEWKQAGWSRQVLSIAMFMVLAMAIALAQVGPNFPWLAYSLLGAAVLALAIVGWSIRPRRQPGHVDPAKEPIKAAKLQSGIHFAFADPRFGLAFGEMNGLDRQELLKRWKLDPQILKPKL